ncbi:hypothetical protein BJ684DRAFT_19657 [Piptocephalis cylindrospora]|uniref:Fumarylacetoacetase-like C-terminal domain-containing protein n=1 Tax=Piptocephalis cylindrospora TaxID=1907219 RepID=A0A4V1IYA6_9FUNG|nr:hypothetical protein BJ684DRAFT_19657 [Piptocephalis cylindrospora]|eukprot:RKP13889.1 hypothetical protein BJ684DRAFT_19657 [Piptocephalis cylindrospora]
MATKLPIASFSQWGRKIVAIGRNYSEHAKELGNAVPTAPFFFLKPPSSYLEANGTILLPKGAEVHHEVELGVVMGETAREVQAKDAMKYVAGYALGIDLTARNLQAQAKSKGLPWSAAKGYDTFTPIGTFLPASKVPVPEEVRLWLRVGQETRQDGWTRDMLFDIPQLIEHVSSIMTLERGDVLLTGTPKGVGPIQTGDTVTAGLEAKDGVSIEYSWEVKDR